MATFPFGGLSASRRAPVKGTVDFRQRKPYVLGHDADRAGTGRRRGNRPDDVARPASPGADGIHEKQLLRRGALEGQDAAGPPGMAVDRADAEGALGGIGLGGSGDLAPNEFTHP